jgi:[acyl-carrier-protein] S-malonyltransferase
MMKAALFPGQGISREMVLESLDPHDPTVEAANDILGTDIRKQLSIGIRAQDQGLPSFVAEPAIFTASLVSWQRARDEGQSFSHVVGHSLGEYAALVAGGAWSFKHALCVVRVRAWATHQACRAGGDGGMLALLGSTLKQAEELASESGAAVANDNAPGQVVVSGSRAALERCAALAPRYRSRCIKLDVEGAFHTSAMLPAVEHVRDALDHVLIRQPELPVISNVTARPYRAPGEIRKLLVRQMTERVRFRESVEWLWSRGCREFTDLGPGRVVAGLARRTAAHLETLDSNYV